MGPGRRETTPLSSACADAAIGITSAAQSGDERRGEAANTRCHVPMMEQRIPPTDVAAGGLRLIIGPSGPGTPAPGSDAHAQSLVARIVGPRHHRGAPDRRDPLRGDRLRAADGSRRRREHGRNACRTRTCCSPARSRMTSVATRSAATSSSSSRPTDPSQDFIKRVIGLPGDVIEIDGDHNPTEVLIKPGGKGPFQVLNEPYLPRGLDDAQVLLHASREWRRRHPQPLVIPAGEYFVMGDNRNYLQRLARLRPRAPQEHPRQGDPAHLAARITLAASGLGAHVRARGHTALAIPALGIAAFESWRWRRRRMRRLVAAHAARSPIADPLD